MTAGMSRADGLAPVESRMNEPAAAAAGAQAPVLTEPPRVRRAVKASVLEAVGDTPLVRLSRLFDDAGLEAYAKLEALNPGGSIKDRPAYNILMRALEDGEI